jgi:7-cyano-7-deazaguanine synthase
MGVKYNLDLKNTHTCYEGHEVACGECPACSSRLKGFIDAGYIDPIEYAKDIDWESYNCKAI